MDASERKVEKKYVPEHIVNVTSIWSNGPVDEASASVYSGEFLVEESGQTSHTFRFARFLYAVANKGGD